MMGSFVTWQNVMFLNIWQTSDTSENDAKVLQIFVMMNTK